MMKAQTGTVLRTIIEFVDYSQTKGLVTPDLLLVRIAVKMIPTNDMEFIHT